MVELFESKQRFPSYVFKKNNLLSWSERSTALCMTRAGPTTRPEHQHG